VVYTTIYQCAIKDGFHKSGHIIMYLYYTIKSKQMRIFKNLKFKKLSRDWLLLQKVRKQEITFWHKIFLKV